MKNLLAANLQLPGSSPIPTIPIPGVGANSSVKDASIGGVLSPAFEIVFLIVSFLMFIWMVWGIFQYIFAGGNKEALAKARSRITWAIVGFCIVLLAFTIQRYAREIFPPQNPNVQTISEPSPIPKP